MLTPHSSVSPNCCLFPLLTSLILTPSHCPNTSFSFRTTVIWCPTLPPFSLFLFVSHDPIFLCSSKFPFLCIHKEGLDEEYPSGACFHVYSFLLHVSEMDECICVSVSMYCSTLDPNFCKSLKLSAKVQWTLSLLCLGYTYIQEVVIWLLFSLHLSKILTDIWVNSTLKHSLIDTTLPLHLPHLLLLLLLCLLCCFLSSTPFVFACVYLHAPVCVHVRARACVCLLSCSSGVLIA